MFNTQKLNILKFAFISFVTALRKKLIELVQVSIDLQLADLFTKAFDKKRFEYLITALGMINLE